MPYRRRSLRGDSPMNGVARGLREGSDADDIIRPSLINTDGTLTPHTQHAMDTSNEYS